MDEKIIILMQTIRRVEDLRRSMTTSWSSSSASCAVWCEETAHA